MVADAIIGAAGSLLSSGLNFLGGGLSYKSSKRLQDRQNSWMERMSNTAYQRATKDMRSAGLNPALMYGNASSASTPSAGSATGPQFDMGDPVNSAMNVLQTRENILNTRANTAFANEQAKTEASKRAQLDADAGLKKIQTMVEDKTLPYSLRKMASETEKIISERMLNDEVRKYTGYNAESNRIQANSASANVGANYISANASKISAERYTPSQVLGSFAKSKQKDFDHFVKNNKLYKGWRKYSPIFMFNQ